MAELHQFFFCMLPVVVALHSSPRVVTIRNFSDDVIILSQNDPMAHYGCL